MILTLECQTDSLREPGLRGKKPLQPEYPTILISLLYPSGLLVALCLLPWTYDVFAISIIYTTPSHPLINPIFTSSSVPLSNLVNSTNYAAEKKIRWDHQLPGKPDNYCLPDWEHGASKFENNRVRSLPAADFASTAGRAGSWQFHAHSGTPISSFEPQVPPTVIGAETPGLVIRSAATWPGLFLAFSVLFRDQGNNR